jgi:hypothetical protein
MKFLVFSTWNSLYFLPGIPCIFYLEFLVFSCLSKKLNIIKKPNKKPIPIKKKVKKSVNIKHTWKPIKFSKNCQQKVSQKWKSPASLAIGKFKINLFLIDNNLKSWRARSFPVPASSNLEFKIQADVQEKFTFVWSPNQRIPASRNPNLILDLSHVWLLVSIVDHW